MPSPPATFSPLTTTNVGRVALAQHRQAVEQRAPADAADDVADEQDPRRRRRAVRGAPRTVVALRPPRAQPYSGDGGRQVSGRPRERPDGEPPTAEEQRRREPSGRRRRSRGEQAAQPPRAVVPRWVQLVLLPIALLALWALAKAAGKVLLIFIVAALIALILNPAVAFLQRRGLPRGLACWPCTSHSS